MHYPMYVIRLRDALELTDLKPHQELLVVSLWTNMLVSDAYYQEKAVKRFKAL